MLGISYRSIIEDYLGVALIQPVDYVIIIISRYMLYVQCRVEPRNIRPLHQSLAGAGDFCIKGNGVSS